jgi:TolB protein
MTRPDPLSETLHDLAEVVTPVDLLERSLTRSRRIGRREAAIGTGAALIALGLLGSGLWHLPSASPQQHSAAAAAPPPAAEVPAGAPAASVSPSASGSEAGGSTPTRSARDRPRGARTTNTAQSSSLRDLPGQVFYEDAAAGHRVVRLDRDGDPETVLTAEHSTVGVSPDGARLAYVADGTLMVVETGGSRPRQAYEGTASAEQAPAWSPDGSRLLIDAADPGVLEVGTGRLTPLPSGLAGEHYRWSGDGSTLVYATAGCGLEVADATAQTGTPVPEQTGTEGVAACRPVSVDATGDLVTVRLQSGSAAGGDAPADAVVDTVTGDLVDLPVTGKVIGAVFDPDGNLLVRSLKGGKTRLWLFDPQFTLLVQAKEPAAVAGLDLVAYTR